MKAAIKHAIYLWQSYQYMFRKTIFHRHGTFNTRCKIFNRWIIGNNIECSFNLYTLNVQREQRALLIITFLYIGFYVNRFLQIGQIDFSNLLAPIIGDRMICIGLCVYIGSPTLYLTTFKNHFHHRYSLVDLRNWMCTNNWNIQ